MKKIIIIGITSGLIFGLLDGIINANPLAQKLFSAYQPIAKKTINLPAGIIIDLIYGLIMAWLFIILFPSLPGKTNLIKGLSFGLIVWFFRVLMQTASTWMMFNIPTPTLVYNLSTGLLEMLILGLFYGLTLSP